MSRRLFPAVAVCVAAAVLAGALPSTPAGAAVKLRYRQESGAVPHADADVLKVFLTNTSDKPATAVVIVHKLGATYGSRHTVPGTRRRATDRFQP